MITRQARIAKLKEQAAEMLRKAEAIASDDAKQKADQKRKADALAKLLLGAGVLLLDQGEQTRTVAAILGRLSPRDRGRVEGWAIERNLDLTGLSYQELGTSATTSDPEATALKRVISRFDVGGLSLLATEFLGVAHGEDKTVLERMFVRLNERMRGDAGAV